jgi:metalloendopeptidase OMA1, mitochondrial
MKITMLRATICGIAVFTLVSCATVTETGRRQLLLINPAQEIQLGLTAFEELKKEQPASRDAGGTEMVRRVGKNIAAVAELPNAQWEFVLFESQEPNAFCLPGGKVGVYSGILPVTKTEGGLAAVIGHEVAHATAHHGAERMSEAMVLQTGGQVAGAAFSDPAWQKAFISAYGVGKGVLRELPHSRKQESEADYIGLLYMARAGYNPQEAVAFWERFAEYNKRSGGGTPWFLRTHPLDEKRIDDLKKNLPKAMEEYRKARGRR